MKLWSRIRSLFTRRKLEADMAEEMRLHLEQRARERAAEGMTSEDARDAALKKFGGVEQAKEIARAQRPGVWLEQCVQDVRYAARQLRRNPGFATVAVLTLALGIGATTAIFSVVNGLLLKPLPYEQPGRLVQVFEASGPGDQSVVSPGMFFDWRGQSTVFEDLAAYAGSTLNFNGGAEPERINGLRMSVNALPLLRAQPVAGRLFASDEDQMGRANVVVITHRLWQRCFNGDRGVIGKPVQLDDQAYTVIGVLPDRFLPFENQEFIVPLVMDERSKGRRDSHWLRVLGRLQPGATLEQAQAELGTIYDRSRSLMPPWKQKWGVALVPMQEQLVQQIKPALLVLLGAVGLVLLIACANVANLLLAKASSRQREIAVRAALGASRARIIRQLLVESVLLSLLGAALGLLLAGWSVGGLRHLLGELGVARAHEIALDARVLGVAGLASLLTGIGFGLAPALQASRCDLNRALKDAARGSAAGGNRVRSALIVGEVAVALVLLVGAGLLVQSFSRLVRVPLGFNPEHALTLQLSLSGPKHPQVAQRVAFFNRIAGAVAAVPRVEAAGFTQTLPLRNPPDWLFRVTGRENQPSQGYGALIDFCTPEYPRAVGIPLVRGRMFQPGDLAAGAHVALVNAELARKYFPGEDPIGRQIEQNGQSWEIVGVVADARMNDFTRPFRPVIYRVQPPEGSWWAATLVVRTHGAPGAAVDAVRRAIREVDPAQPVANVRTLEEIVSASLGERRLTAGLLGAFSVVALVLAAIGLYGVIAYAVTQRTREFGIRLALGARRGDVVRLVLGGGVKLVLAGVGLGLAGAFGLTHLLTKLLYEITPTDPVAFGGVSGLLLLVALFASWLPARRAARVDPIVALRAE